MRWYEYKMETDDLYAPDDLKAKLLAMTDQLTEEEKAQPMMKTAAPVPAQSAPVQPKKKLIRFPAKRVGALAACLAVCVVGYGAFATGQIGLGAKSSSPAVYYSADSTAAAMAAGGADLSDGGPGLMFIFLVNVFNGMPGGRVIGLVFFLCVLFAGLTSLVNLYEVSVEALQDKLHFKRVAAVAVIAVIGTAVSLCIQAIVSQWMDVVSIYICPLGALLAAVMFFWIGGKKLVLESVNLGARKPIGGWYYPLCKYVYCASVLVALVAGAALGGIG